MSGKGKSTPISEKEAIVGAKVYFNGKGGRVYCTILERDRRMVRIQQDASGATSRMDIRFLYKA